MEGRVLPAWNPGNLGSPLRCTPNCSLPLQAGMPRTLSTSDMVTPGRLSPPPTEPTDGEKAGQPFLDGAPSSASLDTLIQHLVPTADYYPEVGEPPRGRKGSREGRREALSFTYEWSRQQGWE